MPAGGPRGYYSSPDKNLIREQFDLPLLERLHSINGDSLGYFGLPGEELRDIRCWGHLLGEVAAVEKDSSHLLAIDETVKMEMPGLRFTPHLGDVDRVILDGRGEKWDRGGQPHQPSVGRYDLAHDVTGWFFNVVNLDYYGPFLPESGGGKARSRANALRKLFEIERLDARNRWVLMVTVAAQKLRPDLNTEIIAYLKGIQDDANTEASEALKFLTHPTGGMRSLSNTRIIHGVTAALIHLAASNSNLTAIPRGTVLYRGASNQPMVHLAYEFEPHAGSMPPPTPLLNLLNSPILTISEDGGNREIGLLGAQPPSMTEANVRNTLEFLDNREVDRIVAQLI